MYSSNMSVEALAKYQDLIGVLIDIAGFGYGRITEIKDNKDGQKVMLFEMHKSHLTTA